METEQKQSGAARVMAVLEVLSSGDAAKFPDGMTVSDVSRALGRDKSAVSRQLSWRLFALSLRAGDQRLTQMAVPMMFRLTAVIRELSYASTRHLERMVEERAPPYENGEVMQVVIRALEVLKVLSRAPKGMTLGEISERLELPVATAHRTAAVLEQQRFITRSSSNRRYFLGPAVRELVQSDYSRESPLVTAHRAVAEASRRSGETVFLSEFAGDKVVCLALSESKFPLRLYVRVGQTMPLHAAAAARTLLAWQQPDRIQKLLANTELTAFTAETPNTVNAVMDHLAQIRSRGYDICESELDENVWAVSAPVRSSTGEVVASITLAAPRQRMLDQQDRDEAVKVIQAAADEMAADLGWAAADA